MKDLFFPFKTKSLGLINKMKNITGIYVKIDIKTAWKRVHDANMQKTIGVKKSRPNPLGLPDLIKPNGWEAPQHIDNVGKLNFLDKE